MGRGLVFFQRKSLKDTLHKPVFVVFGLKPQSYFQEITVTRRTFFTIKNRPTLAFLCL